RVDRSHPPRERRGWRDEPALAGLARIRRVVREQPAHAVAASGRRMGVVERKQEPAAGSWRGDHIRQRHEPRAGERHGQGEERARSGKLDGISRHAIGYASVREHVNPQALPCAYHSTWTPPPPSASSVTPEI